MRFAAALLAVLAIGFAGCQTASNRVPLEQIADIRIGEVSVSLADDAQVPSELREAVGPKVKAAMERHLSSRFKGPIPARIDVRVRNVRIASEVETIVIGGTHMMTADITLIDLRTKTVIHTNASFSSAVGGGAG